MEHRFDRLEEKIDSINEKLNKNNEILAINTFQLTEHIKRTALLENRVDPLEKGYMHANGVIKFFVLIGVVGAVVQVVMSIFKH